MARRAAGGRTRVEDPRAALARLLPPEVATAVLGVGAAPVCVEEEALVPGAGARRRAEFRAGRACARAALVALGVRPVAVGRGAYREPLWPPGVVGSITHGGDLAAAAAARSEDAWAVAVDVEPLLPELEPGVDRLVRRPDERAADGGAHAAKIAFCAKECVYKALFPRTGWALGFHDVRVHVAPDRGTFRAEVDARFRLDSRPLRPLEGRYAVHAGHVLAALAIPPSGPALAQGVRRSGPRNR